MKVYKYLGVEENHNIKHKKALKLKLASRRNTKTG
jgi:hypothetical protein